MALTRSYRETIREQIEGDAEFGRTMLLRAIELLVTGEVDVGKSLLRDYITVTIGFEKLGARLRMPPKSLIRMFGPRGNPQAKNLFAILSYLQKHSGTRVHVAQAKPAKRAA